MHPAAIAAAIVAALVHAWFFLLESVWFMRPRSLPGPALVAILAGLLVGAVGG